MFEIPDKSFIINIYIVLRIYIYIYIGVSNDWFYA